jgi:HK97 family phage portal protein
MQRFKRIQDIFKKSFPFSQLQPTWLNNQPKWNDWSTERAIKEGYKVSTYVYACINAISKASASVPWKVYKKNRQGIWEEVEGHPLQLLIDKPNAFHSRKDLIERMTLNLYLGGNAYFTKVRANNIVAELWSMPSDKMKIIPSKNDFIAAYLYEADGVKKEIPPRDMIHNLFIDPSNPYIGMSPLQAGARAVDTDVEAVAWNKVSLQNRAVTDGTFTFEQHLTKEQWEEARAMVREQHQGADNAHTPWILGAGAKWQPMSLSPQEMDFIESRRFTRSEICSIFQVPPPIVGIYDDATLANIETARKIFWLDTVIPYLEDIKNCFNQSLTPDFGTDIELSFDVSNIEAIQTNLTEKLTNAKQLWSMGVPFNDINQRLELGFDEIEGGDTGYLPTGVMPADMPILEPDQDPQPEGEEDEDEDDSGTPPEGQEDDESGAKKKVEP